MTATEMKTKATEWLGERLDISAVRELIEHKTVPVHSATRWYYFGGITLFLFLLASETLRSGEAALHEKDVRRFGLAVSALLIAITLAAIWLLIRRIEAKDAGANRPLAGDTHL